MANFGDGRNLVADGQVIDTAWGNAIADHTVQTYASFPDLLQQWPAARNGSMAYIADTDEFIQLRGGGWHRWPQGFMGQVRGPGAGVDCRPQDGPKELLRYTFPAKVNRQYLVVAYAVGTQVTKGGNIAKASIQDDQGGSQWVCHDSTLAVNSVCLGTTTYLYAPTSTKTAWVRILGEGATTGGAYRFAPNSAMITITDIGGG